MSERTIAEYRAEIEASLPTLPYEDARQRLAEIVSRLEQGAIPLEDSLALWEIGELLAAHCQRWLAGARERLDAVRAAADAAEHTCSAQQDSVTSSGEYA